MKKLISVVAVIGLLSLLVGCPLFQFQLLPRVNPFDPGAWDGKYLPDESLGGRGFIQVHDDLVVANPDNEQGNDVAVDDFGRIIVSGYRTDFGALAESRMAVFRFGDDGSLDNTFGTMGWVADFQALSGEENSWGNSLVMWSEDEFYVVGNVRTVLGNSNVGIWRIDGGGNFNNTFAGNGFTKFDGIAAFPGTDDFANDAIINPNGGVYVVGTTFDPGMEQMVFILAVLDDGSPDGSFNTTGQRLLNEGGVEWANGVAKTPDGNLVITGGAQFGLGPFKLYIYRLAGDETGPVAVSDWSNQNAPDFDSFGNDVAVDQMGNIYVVGTTAIADGRFRIVVVKFRSDGSIDDGFGTDGAVIAHHDEGGNDQGESIAVDDQGRILVTGYVEPFGDASEQNLVLIRVTPDGLLDDEFGNGGIVRAQYSNTDPISDRGHGITIDQAGRIVIAGQSFVDGQDKELTVWRFFNP